MSISNLLKLTTTLTGLAMIFCAPLVIRHFKLDNLTVATVALMLYWSCAVCTKMVSNLNKPRTVSVTPQKARGIQVALAEIKPSTHFSEESKVALALSSEVVSTPKDASIVRSNVSAVFGDIVEQREIESVAETTTVNSSQTVESSPVSITTCASPTEPQCVEVELYAPSCDANFSLVDLKVANAAVASAVPFNWVESIQLVEEPSHKLMAPLQHEQCLASPMKLPTTATIAQKNVVPVEEQRNNVSLAATTSPCKLIAVEHRKLVQKVINNSPRVKMFEPLVAKPHKELKTSKRLVDLPHVTILSADRILVAEPHQELEKEFVPAAKADDTPRVTVHGPIRPINHYLLAAPLNSEAQFVYTTRFLYCQMQEK